MLRLLSFIQCAGNLASLWQLKRQDGPRYRSRVPAPSDFADKTKRYRRDDNFIRSNGSRSHAPRSGFN